MVTRYWSANTLFSQVSNDHYMTNIKEGRKKPRLHVSVNPLAGVYMAAILRDSVVVVVAHTCP